MTGSEATTTTPATVYTERRERFEAAAARLSRRAALLSHIRLITFLAVIGLIILQYYFSAGGAALCFLAAAVVHDRVLRLESRMRLRANLNARGLARLDGQAQELEKGERYRDIAHPYAADLDLFGPGSLFERMDATATLPGERRLVDWLSRSASEEEIVARQSAVHELAQKVDWREALEVEGRLLGKEKRDPERLIAFAASDTGAPSVELPQGLSRAWRIAAWLLPGLTLASLAAGDALGTTARLALLPLTIQALVVFATRRRITRITALAGLSAERLIRWAPLFEVIEQARFDAQRLKTLQSRLSASSTRASLELRRLERGFSFLKVREQPLLHLPINLVFLWDLNWLLFLERWQQRCGHLLSDWFDSLADAEALSSLAILAFDHPEWATPEIRREGPIFIGQSLGHPLLPSQRRVGNDVELASPGTALIITGSNMAGKTTLLRAIGVNSVLALAGAPVCARSLTLSAFSIQTSMRVSDSLSAGLSLFYAEVRRLKAILDACGAGRVLFLLDEVLHGTNTTERHLASRSIIKQLLAKNAIGAIATHDLGLASLEEETSHALRNVHFTDLIDNGKMAFDFRLRPGVVKTTNALAILQLEGIEIEAPSSQSSRS